MQRLEKSFDAFFKGDAKVAVLKGAWGVGKTFFWHSYIQKRIEEKNLTQIAYSYVSLFGKTSLPDLRSSIFQSAKPILSNKEIEQYFNHEIASVPKFFTRFSFIRSKYKDVKVKAQTAGRFTKLLKFLPAIDKYSNLISFFEYNLINNFVICFDDLERKGETLSIKEIMGLVDEFVHQKACKVVLIFNDAQLDEKGDEDFKAYKDKVVDIELLLDPTHKQNLSYIFPENHQLFKQLENVLQILNIQNIRIIIRLKRIIDLFWPKLQSSDIRIVNEFINHATILCWAYYAKDTVLSYQYVKTNLVSNVWTSHLFGIEEKVLPEEKKFAEIVIQLKLSTSILDKHIIQYLEKGYIDTEAFVESIKEFSRVNEADRAHDELYAVWDLYSSSFAGNLSEIITSFKTILKKHVDRLKIDDFFNALHFLYQFGQDVTEYVKLYADLHEKEFLEFKKSATHRLHLNIPPSLLENIKFEKRKINELNIDEAATRIASREALNPEDIEFLTSLTDKEYYDWIKSNPENLMRKLRYGLLTLDSFRGATPENEIKFKAITETVKKAIKKLATENPLNKMRAKALYEIE